MCVCVPICVCLWHEGMRAYVCEFMDVCLHAYTCTCVCVCVCVCACLASISERQAQVIPSLALAKWPQASPCLPCQSHPISQGDASPGWRSRLRMLLNTQIVPGLFLVLADSRGGKWIPPLLRNSKFIPSSVTTGRRKCYKTLYNNQQSWTECFLFCGVFF